MSLLVNYFVFCTSKKEIFDVIKNLQTLFALKMDMFPTQTVLVSTSGLLSIKQIVSIRGYYLAQIPAKPGLSAAPSPR